MTLSSGIAGDRSLSTHKMALVHFFVTVFTAILITGFQSQFLPYFESLLVDAGNIWRIVYYGFWASAVLLAVFIALTVQRVRMWAAPTTFVCLYSLLLTSLHPLDSVAKNFLVSMILAACLSVFISILSWKIVARFSASVVALMAILCLLDILFRDGFTNTGGRAAGFGINPNVAAAGLLLGAVATYQALPEKWRFPFLSLVATALMATLSRSTLLVGAMGLGLVISAGVFEQGRTWRPRLPERRKFKIHGLLLIFFAGWLALAAVKNDHFTWSMRSSFSGLETAINAVIAAERKFALLARKGTSENTTSFWGDAAPDDPVEAIDEQGEVNSAGTRALLFKRSMRAFLSGPWLGVGLQQAHDYHPHNTYLLFAVAFGWPGLFVPFGFLALTVLRAKRRADLALGLTAAGLMFFSHDMLLAPGLLIPLIVGIAKHSSPLPQYGSERAHTSALKVVAGLTAALFLVGAASVAVRQTGLVRMALESEKIYHSHRNIYYAGIKPILFGGLLRTADTPSEGGQLILYENGHPTAPRAHFEPKEYMRNGEFYQQRRNHIVFAATDNSDPRGNRRSYSVDFTVGVHPLMYLALIAIFAWCAGIFLLYGGQSPRRKG